MKKFIALILALCLVFTMASGLTACTKPDDTGEDTGIADDGNADNGDGSGNTGDGNLPDDTGDDTVTVDVRPEGFKLRMTDGEFKILHLADFHECFNGREWFDERNLEFMERIVDYTKPDLVVLGGDNVFPLSTLGELMYQETLKTIAGFGKFFDEREQYWTMVFGNHDDECIFSKSQQLEHALKTSEYFVGGLEDGSYYKAFCDTEKEMIGNMAFPVYNGDEHAYNIFLFDSGSARAENAGLFGGKYNYIRDNQVEWYKNIALSDAEANGGVPVPSVMITHIPLHEHKEAFYNRFDTSVVEKYVYDLAGHYSLSAIRSTLYDVAVNRVKDVKGIFTGHNHLNGFTAVVKAAGGNKVMLSTTRQAGVYWENGVEYTINSGRLITLKADGSLSTYEYHDSEEYHISID